MSEAIRITEIEGSAIPVRGDDIDTDRIIPARFLRSVSFEGLDAHLFEDDRRTVDGRSSGHPFDNSVFRGAAILLVNRNFGCGSSREHAPQAIRRWGIEACVGESFSEIFFGNSVALGLPCLTVNHDAIERLMRVVETKPTSRLRINIDRLTVDLEGDVFRAAMPPAAHTALLTGAWDATGLLLDRFDEVQAVARRLPYVSSFVVKSELTKEATF